MIRLLILSFLLLTLWLTLKLLFRIYGVYHVWQHLVQSLQSGSKASGSSKDMVKCAKCQIYVPASQAVEHEGQTYCCQAHANSKSNDDSNSRT